MEEGNIVKLFLFLLGFLVALLIIPPIDKTVIKNNVSIESIKDPSWERPISDVRVVDGDTVECLIDLGFGVVLRDYIRVEGVNTPELHSTNSVERTAAKKAKEFVENELKDADKIVITTSGKRGKYGRPLGDIRYFKGGEWKTLTEELLSNDLCKEYIL